MATKEKKIEKITLARSGKANKKLKAEKKNAKIKSKYPPIRDLG